MSLVFSLCVLCGKMNDNAILTFGHQPDIKLPEKNSLKQKCLFYDGLISFSRMAELRLLYGLFQTDSLTALCLIYLRLFLPLFYLIWLAYCFLSLLVILNGIRHFGADGRNNPNRRLQLRRRYASEWFSEASVAISTKPVNSLLCHAKTGKQHPQTFQPQPFRQKIR